MPLDPQHQAVVAGEFHGLHGAVRGMGARREAGSQTVHGLVVVGGHHVRFRDGRRVRRTGNGNDGVFAEDAGAAGVSVQVLVQGAAERDVEQLHAPADAQQGDVLGDRRLDQGDFPRVALACGRTGPGVGHLAVAGRFDIGAASDDHTVQCRHGLPGRVGGVVGRQHHRQAAGRPYQARVDGGQQDGRGVPDTPPGRFLIGADADDGPVHGPLLWFVRCSVVVPPLPRTGAAAAVRACVQRPCLAVPFSPATVRPRPPQGRRIPPPGHSRRGGDGCRGRSRPVPPRTRRAR